MQINCKLCGGNFRDSYDSVVFCSHHNGVVHLGCCVDKCSLDKQPCSNADATYDRI